MNTHLLHRERDFDLQGPRPWNESALLQDLELPTLLQTMADGDELVQSVALTALLTGWQNDPDTITYRQAIFWDALNHPAVLRELYALAGAALEDKRAHYFSAWGNFPSSVLRNAIDLMQRFVIRLRELRELARAHAASFSSEGFRTLFEMLDRELTDDYLARAEAQISELRFRDGVLISAGLGPGNKGRDHVLRRASVDKRSWLCRLFDKRSSQYMFEIHSRDDAGLRALGELRDRGVHLVANALAQSAEHVEHFFQRLRIELAFYIGCLNLSARLATIGAPICFPTPLALGSGRLRASGLYDPCLALRTAKPPAGNALAADGKSLMLVTGANQGGKSTFLRAVGIAQLALQCGMPVAAESFEGALSAGLATHFKREEDAALRSGKLDEELVRLSEIADHFAPGMMVLFNESFAATNEREGSEIARDVVSALLEKGIRVFFVTHLHAFARGFFERGGEHGLFLRAERLPDGRRTFRVLEGEPLSTSYAEDLYLRIFAGDRAAHAGPTSR